MDEVLWYELHQDNWCPREEERDEYEDCKPLIIAYHQGNVVSPTGDDEILVSLHCGPLAVLK